MIEYFGDKTRLFQGSEVAYTVGTKAIRARAYAPIGQSQLTGRADEPEIGRGQDSREASLVTNVNNGCRDSHEMKEVDNIGLKLLEQRREELGCELVVVFLFGNVVLPPHVGVGVFETRDGDAFVLIMV